MNNQLLLSQLLGDDSVAAEASRRLLAAGEDSVRVIARAMLAAVGPNPTSLADTVEHFRLHSKEVDLDQVHRLANEATISVSAKQWNSRFKVTSKAGVVEVSRVTENGDEVLGRCAFVTHDQAVQCLFHALLAQGIEVRAKTIFL